MVCKHCDGNFQSLQPSEPGVKVAQVADLMPPNPAYDRATTPPPNTPPLGLTLHSPVGWCVCSLCGGVGGEEKGGGGESPHLYTAMRRN